MSWARSRLQSLLQNMESNIKPEKGTAKVLGMKELTGDVRLAPSNVCRLTVGILAAILKAHTMNDSYEVLKLCYIQCRHTSPGGKETRH